MPSIELPNHKTDTPRENPARSVARLSSVSSSKSDPDIVKLIDKGKQALSSLNSVTGELFMLNVAPHDLEQMRSSEIASRHQQLQSRLNPALCAHHPDLPPDFHTRLFTKLNAGAREIISALQNPHKRLVLLRQLGHTPAQTMAPAPAINLSAATLPSPSAESKKREPEPAAKRKSVTINQPKEEILEEDTSLLLTVSKSAEPIPSKTCLVSSPSSKDIAHQDGRALDSIGGHIEEGRTCLPKSDTDEKREVQTSPGGPSADLPGYWTARSASAETTRKQALQNTNKDPHAGAPTTPNSPLRWHRIATLAKVVAASSVGLFVGMKEYAPHRNEIRRQVPDELMPTYDAIETALYGTYRAERSALEKLARMLDEAVNGNAKKQSTYTD